MSLTASAFSAGFIAQASLIMAIGAQNSFILRQGLQQRHVGPLVAFCIVSDILLAGAGVMGLTSALSLYPSAMRGMEYVAIIFLFGYAALSFRRACAATSSIASAGARGSSLSACMALMAGFTWLNPHVWLDTVLLLGTVAQTQPAAGKLPFLAGASISSTLWFITLGYGARLMQSIFSNPAAWRILDALTGTMMTLLAISLILGKI